MKNPLLTIHKSTLMNLYNHLENLRDLMYHHPYERKVYNEVFEMVFNDNEHFENMMILIQKSLNGKEVK